MAVLLAAILYSSVCILLARLVTFLTGWNQQESTSLFLLIGIFYLVIAKLGTQEDRSQE